MPKVSVIMPTYNGQLYIEEAINSVLNQSMSDLELIVVDDASTDGTPAILARMCKVDSRIRVISRESPSGGPTIPKNQALAIVNSPYVCFLDHDDYYHPDKLQLMCAGMDAHPEWVAAFHDLQLVHADGKEFTGTYLSTAEFLSIAADYLAPLTESGWYDCGSNFYTFMTLRYAGMHTDSVIVAPQRLLADPVSFRRRFRGSDDTNLWLRIGAQGAVGYLDTVLAYYRQHDNNLSSDSLAMIENAAELHQDNYMQAKHFLNRQQLAQYRKKITNCYLDIGYHLYKNKQFSKSRSIFADAIRQGRLIKGIQGVIKAWLFQLLDKIEISKNMTEKSIN